MHSPFDLPLLQILVHLFFLDHPLVEKSITIMDQVIKEIKMADLLK